MCCRHFVGEDFMSLHVTEKNKIVWPKNYKKSKWEEFLEVSIVKQH